MSRMVSNKGFVFVVVALSFGAYADVPVFPVVGEYESASSSNVVDASASYYSGNSSGAGQVESLVVSIDEFRKEVRAAYSNSCGGVVNFDNGLIAGGSQTDQFKAGFGEDKFLVIQSVDHLRTDVSAPAVFHPISGPGQEPSGGFLAKSNAGGDQIKIQSNYNFTFTESNFGSNEHVREVGGTILGRNGGPDQAKWLMKVTLDNGDTIAEIAEINFRSGNSVSDTFFGAKAPKGRYITGVAWINLSDGYTGLDGFAFITNGAPPKRQNAAGNKRSDFFDTDTYGKSTGSSGSSDDDGGVTTLFGRTRP